jgi:hypothetical protein
MIYEWRAYEAMPGKMAALNERFEKYTNKLFVKHGIKIVGFWTADIGEHNTLYYMLAYGSLAAREKAWHSMLSDPEFDKAMTMTERDGPLVTKYSNAILKPTSYSPMK